MPGYTFINLRDDVEDVAPKFGMPDGMEARFASRDLGLRRCGASLQKLAAGGTQPFGHRHHEQEELYVILAGGGTVKLDDEEVGVRAWDAIRVEPGVTRAFSAGPDGLELLAFGAPGLEDPAADVEMTPGWWDGPA